MSEYLEQVHEFLEDTNTKLDVTKIGCLMSLWGERPVDTYSVVLTNARHTYEFKFYSSLADTYGPLDGREPRCGWPEEFRAVAHWKREMRKKDWSYDVLACLCVDQSEDFEDFCADYGYNEDSIKALETWRAVRTETKNLKRLFNDKELQLLQEIN